MKPYILTKQLNWIHFRSAIPDEVTDYTVVRCNRQSLACPVIALMFGCSARYIYLWPRTAWWRLKYTPWDNDRASWSRVLPRPRTRAHIYKMVLFSPNDVEWRIAIQSCWLSPHQRTLISFLNDLIPWEIFPKPNFATLIRLTTFSILPNLCSIGSLRCR